MTLSEIRVNHVLQMGSTHTQDYNCWGATQYVLGAKDHLEWVENREMSMWILENTKPVPKPDKGDVLALFVHMRDNPVLIHTAVYIGGGKYLHKKGRNVAEITTLKGVLKTYSEAEIKIHARLKGDEQ